MVHRFDEIAINSTAKKKPEESDRFCYIGLEHIEPGTFEISHWGADAAPVGEKLIMRKGDILFGKRRAYQRKVAIAPFDGIFSAHGMVLRPKEEVICKEYFPFFLSSDQFMDTAIRISVGGLSPTINWKDLQQQEFDLPSLEEQRRLADKLWAAYELKEAYKKMIAATDEMVKAQFIEMFCSTKTNYKKYKLNEIASILSGFAFKSEKYTDQGVRIIRIVNVQKGYIEDLLPQYYPSAEMINLEKYLLKENDILLSLTGNVGRVGLLTKNLLPAALNQRVACIRPNENIINNNFLFRVMNMDIFEKDCINNASGSAQKNLSTEWLKNYEIITPPLNEQEQYIEIVNQAEKSKSELRQAIEKIDRVMKSLMQ